MIFCIQSRSFPTSISFSPDYTMFVVFSFKDRHVRVFNFATGKLFKKYDETLENATEKQGMSLFSLLCPDWLLKL